MAETKAALVKAKKQFEDGKFITDLDEIARVSPEFPEGLVYRAGVHVSQSTKSKHTSDSLKRVLGKSELEYHAVNLSDDKKTLCTLSRQNASFKHDPKTRNQVKPGERSKFLQYTVFQCYDVEPTSLQEDGHVLRRVVGVRLSYCTCCIAGMEDCIHIPMSDWTQFHMWGEDRPVEAPSTLGHCEWRRAVKRKLAVTDPVSEMQIAKMPGSTAEAKRRDAANQKRNVTEGTSGQYMCYTSQEKSEKAKRPRRFDASRIAVRNFFNAVRE